MAQRNCSKADDYKRQLKALAQQWADEIETRRPSSLPSGKSQQKWLWRLSDRI